MTTFPSVQSILSYINGSNHINSKDDQVHAAIYVLATAVKGLQDDVALLQTQVKSLRGQ